MRISLALSARQLATGDACLDSVTTICTIFKKTNVTPKMCESDEASTVDGVLSLRAKMAFGH